MTVTPCLILPLRTLAQARADRARLAPVLSGCPDCGFRPDIDPAFHGQFCIFCNNDNCSQKSGDGWPQAMGATLAEASVKWNTRHRTIIEFPASELDQLIGAASRL